MQSAQIISALLFILALNAVAAPSGTSEMTMDDIMKEMEDSELVYAIDSMSKHPHLKPETFPDLFWPRRPDYLTHPTLDSGVATRPEPINFVPSEACSAGLKRIEPIFAKKDFTLALKAYKFLGQQTPGCYLALVAAADCARLQHAYIEAAQLYDQALALNPHDHQLYFFKGKLLLETKRLSEARDAWIEALTLHPQDAEVLQALKSNQALLGVELSEKPFRPNALARHAGNGVVVTVADAGKNSQPHWLTYGLLKAIWLGEESFRKRKTGSTQHVWTSTEELQALESMLAAYELERKQGDFKPDPEANRIRDIFKDGLGLGFVLYEIGSRVDPHLMLRADKVERDKTRSYISKYVAPALKK